MNFPLNLPYLTVGSFFLQTEVKFMFRFAYFFMQKLYLFRRQYSCICNF